MKSQGLGNLTSLSPLVRMFIYDMIPCFSSHVLKEPRLLEDKSGRPCLIRLYHDDERDYSLVKKMYERFEPKEWTQGLPHRSDKVREEWLQYVFREGINVLAIMDEGVVGHAALFEMESGKSCEYLVFVHQDFQNRGIGTALTQTVKELAEEMGYRRMLVTVEVINFKAIHVYEKCGFCPVGSKDIECEMVLHLKDDDEG